MSRSLIDVKLCKLTYTLPKEVREDPIVTQHPVAVIDTVLGGTGITKAVVLRTIERLHKGEVVTLVLQSGGTLKLEIE